MKTWILRAAALAAALALAACGGGDGGGGTVTPPVTTPPPGAAQRSVPPLVSELYFDYELTREGEGPIEEKDSVPLSCPEAGCAASDLRTLSGAGMREGFATVSGTTGGPPLTEVFAGVSATVFDASFTRYGFWAVHGYAAVEVGAGALSVAADGELWRGRFMTAHAWAAGEASGTNPAGTGSAAWRGIAEAVRTADFERLPGTAEVRVADLSRPLVEVGIDLEGVSGPLEWTGMQPAGGRFAKGAAGADRIEGRFHGPGHEEAWGAFDTGAYVGAFGAKRR